MTQTRDYTYQQHVAKAMAIARPDLVVQAENGRFEPLGIFASS
jgi:hypothetical protein